MSIGTPGSIAAFMDALVTLEGTIDTGVRVYRWRPARVPTLPCIYNWLPPSTSEVKATRMVSDALDLQVRCGIRHTDADQDMLRLETLFDATRDVLDRDLIQPQQSTLAAVCREAHRVSTRTVLDTFNQIDVLCLELTLRVTLDRLI